MRVVALDVGDKRIGVAMSDPTGTIATPLTTIRRIAEKKDHLAILGLTQEHSVELVVVGLPVTLRGEMGLQAQRVTRFGERLAGVVGVPVVYWDERYSTTDADLIMRNRGRRRYTRDGVDAVAAAVILQAYLDRVRSSEF